jgi:predicted amino acid-binding ACT domain protein
MSLVSNILVEILPMLTYNLDSIDQTMNDSPFHMMWLVGLQVQIKICMSMFHGKFRNSLHDQEVQEQKSITH